MAIITDMAIIPDYDPEEAKRQCAFENDQAKRHKEYITIDAGYLEHLLNCLANQKYMPAEQDQSQMENKNQQTIDKAWNEGMEMLRPDEKARNIKVIKQ